MSEKKQDRSFGLSPEHVTELTAEFGKTKTLPNPYRSGAYGFTIAALLKLGVNKAHPVAKVHTAFKNAAGQDWYAEWSTAKKRNAETGKDADARFLQNLSVLQRTADYGRKLLEVGKKVMGTKGVVIDLSRDDKGGLLVALNLNSDTPLKPGRQEKAKKPAARKAANGSVKPQDAAGAARTVRKPTPKGKKPRKGGKAK